MYNHSQPAPHGSFVYQQLPPERESAIGTLFSRLIRLAAGKLDQPLTCSMFVVNLQDCPRYEALSYVWGSQEPQVSINLDGHLFPVRPNLELALKHLRLLGQDRFLWVDAICINQSDVTEKTRQVQYMRQVFRRAARVIVWLGAKSPGVELAFQFVGKLAKVMSRFDTVSSDLHERDYQRFEQLAVEVILDSPEGSLDCLNALFNREYFVRSWCLQEVVASSWAVARCEELEIPFFDIISTSNFVQGFKQLLFNDKPLDIWFKVYSSRQEQQKGSSDPLTRYQGPERSLGRLLDLLRYSRDFKSSDPRDKIFSVLGISDEGLDPMLIGSGIRSLIPAKKVPKRHLLVLRAISTAREFVQRHMPDVDLRPIFLKPDYSKPWREVYRDFARLHMARNPQLLEMLHDVHHNVPPMGELLPSWVPRWDEPRFSTPTPPIGCYSAGFCHGFAVIQDLPLRGGAKQPDILSIKGFLIDQVTAVGAPMEFDLQNPIPLEQIWQALFPFPLSSRATQTYRNGEPLDLAFCSTLAMGTTGTLARSISSDPWRNTPSSSREVVQTMIKSQMHSDLFAFMAEELDGKEIVPDQGRSIIPSQTVHDKLQGSSRYRIGPKMYAHNRKLFITRRGYLGLGPKVIEPGDQVCVLYGGSYPFVIRPQNDGFHHLFIGSCYIHDDHIMWGKACKIVKRKHQNAQFKEQLFHLK